MRLLGALVLLLALAVPARADTFGEVPFRPVSGVATCVRATGMPGELARWTRNGVELLRADAGGLTPAGTLALGRAFVCPAVAGHANGSAVVAVLRKGGVHVTVREPGAGFAAPETLPLSESAELVDLAAAASPRGEAVVAVLLTEAGRARVIAFRRAPGGRFGAAENVAAWPAGDAFELGVAAGADGAGRVTLAWSRDATSISSALEVASAAPGAAFGAPSRVGTAQDGDPSLAVAPDGRALLAFESGQTGVTVVEREPGAAEFGPPVSMLGAGAWGPIALSLEDGGGAAVAWRADALNTHNGVRVVTRPGAGAFGAPRDAVPGSRERGDGLLAFGSEAPPQDTPQLAAAIVGANVVLGWANSLGDGGTGVAQAATGALAGGPFARTAVGGPVRPAISLAPLALADGRAALAWADDAVELDDFPTGQGRLHLAVAGAPPAVDAPPPVLTVPRLKRQRRYIDDALVLPLRCAAACDVRAVAHAGRVPGLQVASRAAAGPLTLRVNGFELLRNRPAHVRVTLRWGAPGSRASATRTVRVPIRMLHSPPLPAPVGVRARRSGDDVIVTWRASFASRHGVFLVSALRGHAEPLAVRGVGARGRRTFRLTLHDAAKATRVIVSAEGFSDQKSRQQTVEVH